MGYQYFEHIRKDDIERRKNELQKRIIREKRRVIAMEAIARNFKGAYISKRLEPKFVEVIPEATSVFMRKSQFGGLYQVTIYYKGDGNWRDTSCEINIQPTDEKRIDADWLIHGAAMIMESIRKMQRSLEWFDEAYDEYSKLVDRYAKLFPILQPVIGSDIPFADVEMKRRY